MDASVRGGDFLWPKAGTSVATSGDLFGHNRGLFHGHGHLSTTHNFVSHQFFHFPAPHFSDLGNSFLRLLLRFTVRLLPGSQLLVS